MAAKTKAQKTESSKTSEGNASQSKNKPVKAKSKKEIKKEGALSRFGGYIKDVKAELHRVVWPTKNDVVSYTLVVLSTLIFFGVLIYIIDSLVVPIFVAFAGLR